MPTANKEAVAATGCDRLIAASISRALEERGCPICRLVREAEIGWLKSKLYEGVSDQRTREEFVRSGGLCTYHSWLLASVVVTDPSIHPITAARIYESVLRHALPHISKGRAPPRSGCPACTLAKEFEEMYVDVMAQCLDEGELLTEYSESPATLCLKHYEEVLSRMKSEHARIALIKAQTRKAEELLERMRSYISKQDYASTQEPLGEEATAWSEAIEVLNGYSTSVTIRCPEAPSYTSSRGPRSRRGARNH